MGKEVRDNLLIGCFTVVGWIFGTASLLALLYVAIKFVKWAWYS
jgi:hypothetical protein